MVSKGRQNLEAAARALGVKLHHVDVRGPDDLDQAFADIARAHVGGLLVHADPPVLEPNAERVIALALTHRLPAVHWLYTYPKAGGLMSYGDLYEVHRRSAYFVDRILKGARPADLPVHKDVELIGIGAGPAMVLALEQRKVDAFATGTPVPDAAVHRGFGVMIVDNAAGDDPDFSEFMMNSIIVHPEYAKQNPETVRKITRAMIRANRWLAANPAEAAVGSMKPFLGRLDDAIILAGLRKVRLGIPPDGRITERAYKLTQDFMLKIGAIKTPIPYEAIVTHEYLPK